ncbi:MAG: NAD(P)/FAD-dependent oxidoreductase [Eubacteriales bacterium]|nr:NAD(P)/FAD-dependent oxidoreductase [Eubacteriales bacterium]
MSKKVVILGAGYAGIEAALKLHKNMKKEDDIEISLIDKNSYHTLLTELHEVAGNRIPEEGIRVPLKEIFKYTGVKIIQDEIDNIDFKSGVISSLKNKYAYDYLIMATGSQPNYYGIPGMEENCFPLWSYENAITIREHIKACFNKASYIKEPAARKKLLTFVIGGAGFTGVEMAGELAQWKKSLCREYGIPSDEPEIYLVEALPKILSNLKDKSINKAMNYLEKKLGVKVLLNCSISALSPDEISFASREPLPSTTLIWTAGVKASCPEDGGESDKAKSSRIIVNEYTQTKHENVYAAGDLCFFDDSGCALPALVETALQTGKTAALNILASVRSQPQQKLVPKLHGVMVSIGSFFAVSELMGVEYPRLISMMFKYLVNVHYLFGIGGFELVIRYLKHEFIEKKQKKLLPEKHYSVRNQAFWLVPIRLFLGYSWLVEGINKVKDGWFSKALLAGSPSYGSVSAVSGATADAVSTASVTETGEAVFRIVADHTPGWYEWIAETIVIPNALFFQIVIVLAELAIGAALISGTFTFIAALGALALNVNFLLSTGMYEYNYWYIPAALCVLGGAGRAFGLDYYIMPWLMKQWRYLARNRKLKLRL